MGGRLHSWSICTTNLPTITSTYYSSSSSIHPSISYHPSIHSFLSMDYIINIRFITLWYKITITWMSESKSFSTSSIILKLSLSYGRKTMTVTRSRVKLRYCCDKVGGRLHSWSICTTNLPTITTYYYYSSSIHSIISYHPSIPFNGLHHKHKIRSLL